MQAPARMPLPLPGTSSDAKQSAHAGTVSPLPAFVHHITCTELPRSVRRLNCGQPPVPRESYGTAVSCHRKASTGTEKCLTPEKLQARPSLGHDTGHRVLAQLAVRHLLHPTLPHHFLQEVPMEAPDLCLQRPLPSLQSTDLSVQSPEHRHELAMTGPVRQDVVPLTTQQRLQQLLRGGIPLRLPGCGLPAQQTPDSARVVDKGPRQALLARARSLQSHYRLQRPPRSPPRRSLPRRSRRRAAPATGWAGRKAG